MTIAEFKAWFEGFTERVGDRPTKEDWACVAAKLAEVETTVVADAARNLRTYSDDEVIHAPHGFVTGDARWPVEPLLAKWQRPKGATRVIGSALDHGMPHDPPATGKRKGHL